VTRPLALLTVLSVSGCTCFDADLADCIKNHRCQDFSDAGLDGGLVFSMPALVFPPTPIGGHTDMLALTLQSPAAISVTKITPVGPFTATEQYTGACINRGLDGEHGGCFLDVVYSPTEAGPTTGALHLELSNGDTVDYPLSGTTVRVSFALDPPLTPVVCPKGNPVYRQHRFVNTGDAVITRIDPSGPFPSSDLMVQVSGCAVPLELDGGPPTPSCFLGVTVNSMSVGVPFDTTVAVEVRIGQAVAPPVMIPIQASCKTARNLRLTSVGTAAGYVGVDDYFMQTAVDPGMSKLVAVPDGQALHLHALPFPTYSGFAGWDAGSCGAGFDCDLTVAGVDKANRVRLSGAEPRRHQCAAGGARSVHSRDPPTACAAAATPLC